MTITDDILALEQKQKEYKKNKGKYIQGVATPLKIPKKGELAEFVALKKPHYETQEISFIPKEKDYQFCVDIWESSTTSGYHITAKRDLGDGIIETVTKSMGEEVVITSSKDAK